MRRRQAFAAQTAAREAALLSRGRFIVGPTTVGTSEGLTTIVPKVQLTVGTPVKPQISDNVAHWPSADGAKPALNACPKCGKVVTRGKFMHQKHCKGSAT